MPLKKPKKKPAASKKPAKSPADFGKKFETAKKRYSLSEVNKEVGDLFSQAYPIVLKRKDGKSEVYMEEDIKRIAKGMANTVADAVDRIAGEQKKKKETNPKDAIGVKKAPMSCVSMPVILELGVAMLEGAKKYGRFNYRKIGVRASVYFDAAMRHLFAWYEGEDTDQDSGMSHLVKAMTTMMVLRDAQMRNKMVDDRPPGTSGFVQALNKKAKVIVESGGAEDVQHYATDGTQEEYLA